MQRLHLRNHHSVAGPDLALGAGDGEVLLPAYEDAPGMFAQFCLLSAQMCLATIFSPATYCTLCFLASRPKQKQSIICIYLYTYVLPTDKEPPGTFIIVVGGWVL